MSRSIGDRLPPEVVRAFDGTDLADKIGPAHLLLTTDPDGSPRPCMLSTGEILAVDDRHLRIALWPKTHTGTNLSRGGTALLCYVAPGVVLYIRGTPRRLSPNGGFDAFELAVRSVESDTHAGMPVTSGLTFAVEGDPDRVTEDWRAQLAALREA